MAVHEQKRTPGEVVIAAIHDLEQQVGLALQQNNKTDWASIWGTIRSVGGSFQKAWFASGEERRTVWLRYQAIVEEVKKSQKAATIRRDAFQDRRVQSKRIAEQIVSLAQSAWPHDDGFIDFIATITGAKILAEVFVGLMELTVRVVSFGLLKPDDRDDRAEFLKQCSGKLREAWNLYHDSCDEFVHEDRGAMRELLLRVQAEVQNEWEKFKAEKHGAVSDRVHRKRQLIAEAGSLEKYNGSSVGEQSQALETRWREIGFVGDEEQERELWRDFRDAIDSFWEERKRDRWHHLEQALFGTRANVVKLRSSVEHDEGVLEEKQEKLANVFEGRRAEEIREHLQGVISDIEAKIARKLGWIEEQERRIDDMEQALDKL